MRAGLWAAVALALGVGVAVAGEARGWRDAGNVYAASPTVISPSSTPTLIQWVPIHHP